MRAVRPSHVPAWPMLAIAVSALPLLLASCADAGEAASPRTADARAVRMIDFDTEQVGTTTTPPVRRPPPEFDDADASAVRLFHDVLAPHGTWRDDMQLGLVWSPATEGVGEAFVPYATHGRWSHRSFAVSGAPPIEEYVWVGDLSWGWVTFHYGRWTFAGDRGWAWVPGRRYAGAWVDWRVPAHGGDLDAVIGWGPTPPTQLWRVSPGPRSSRARGASGGLDVRDAHLSSIPYSGFSTPYAYVHVRELFADDVGARLLYGAAALAVARGTHPVHEAPRPELLGFRANDVPAPPTLDRGLQQAWMLATPASASAVGAGPELSTPPRLRTYVTGGPHYASSR